MNCIMFELVAHTGRNDVRMLVLYGKALKETSLIHAPLKAKIHIKDWPVITSKYNKSNSVFSKPDMTDVVVYLQLLQGKVSFVSDKINKILSKIVKPSSETSRLLTEDTTTNLLPGEEVQMSSKRIYTRSILTTIVYFFAFLIFTFPFALVIAFISGILSTIFLLVVWGPVLVMLIASVISEITQTKVTLTNKRIIKETGPGRTISIWYEHVERFDKVSFPDGSGVLYYTLPRTAFGKRLHIRYKVENIHEVNDAFTLVNSSV